MVYATSVYGIPVTSSADPHISQPSGTRYTTTFNFSNSFIQAVASRAINLVNYLDPQILRDAFASNGHPVSGLSIKTPSNKQIVISFISTSPTIVQAITIIAGVFLVWFAFGGPLGWIADFIGIILIGAGALSWIITSVYSELSKPAPFGSAQWAINMALPVALIAGTGLLAFGAWTALSSKEGKRSTVRLYSAATGRLHKAMHSYP